MIARPTVNVRVVPVARTVRTTPPADAVIRALRAGSFATTTPLHAADVAAFPVDGAASATAVTASAIAPSQACRLINLNPLPLADPFVVALCGESKQLRKASAFGELLASRKVTAIPRWHIEGDYFESCNCEAICPCRMVGGVPGGRSTYGICFGVLSWLVREGQADGVDLGGLAVVFTIRYSEDEPGSPWTFVVHVDERGSEEQREALAAILTGRLGGDDILRQPWVRKPSNLVEVRSAPIEIRHGPDGHELRVGRAIELIASRAFETDERVSCIVPGHHVPGRELYADHLAVHDEPFEWELAGNCAYVSTFSYSG
jgi:hypothetical protein